MELITLALLPHTRPQLEINELASSLKKRGTGVEGIFKSGVSTS